MRKGARGEGDRGRRRPAAGWSRASAAIAGVTLLALAGLAILVATPCTAPAQDGKLPAGETVIEMAIEAMGGREAHARQSSRRTWARMEIAAMGIKASVVSTQARPGRVRTVVSSDMIGNMEDGGDGEVFWENSAMTGPSIKKGPDLARARRDADFDGLAGWKTWYAKAETAGADTVGGKPVWKVVLTPKDGPVETWFFEQESGLPVRTTLTLQSKQGEIPVDAALTDYRTVDGLLVAFHTRQSLMGGVQVIDIYADSVRHGVAIPDGFFDPPADVKALIEKEKAGGSAAPDGKSAAPDETPAETPAGSSR